MSLFGDEPVKKQTSSLFDDEQPALGSKSQASSGLFKDGDTEAGGSPWDVITPKKQTRADPVKTLLPGTDVPENYIDTFDALLASGERVGSGISLEGVKRLLEGSKISAEDQRQVSQIVARGGAQSIGRAEFNVLLALIGLAQEKEEVSLDSVDERKSRLPIPKLPQTRPKPTETPTRKALSSSQAPPRDQNRDSIESDPWGSPAKTRPSMSTPGKDSSNIPEYQAQGPQRTTSNFSTSGRLDLAAEQPPSMAASGISEDWGTYNGAESANYSADDPTRTGFGAPDINESSGQYPSQAKLPPRSRASHGNEETLTVTSLSEKEGMFLFQYRNYEISSNRRASKVIRRYSDFVWLLDCLHKRFPFRQLPLLPPKRVSINGNHLATDTLFIEKRRRGLARFANALIRHPVLREEQLVTMFLTVPTELAAWRKQAAITVQEEFTGRSLPPTLEDSLPSSLEDLFASVRSGVRRSCDMYISLCSTLERLVKRREGIAGEYSRFLLGLQSLTETSSETYHLDTNDVPMLNEGINSTAKHMARHQGLVEEESRAWEDGALEDFKRQRDCLVSVRDMFDRRDKYARDNIPTLEKRIQGNESKLSGVRSKPEGTRKVGEAEKLEDAILKDKEAIVAQHARGVFIKECIRDEIRHFQSSQYHISRMFQDWSQERVRFNDMQGENWRALSEEVESMPAEPTH